ncbi:hypothetical protein Tco_0103689 [Tanacetum coccineum]
MFSGESKEDELAKTFLSICVIEFSRLSFLLKEYGSHNKGDQSAPKDFYKESGENVNSKSYAHVVNAGPHHNGHFHFTLTNLNAVLANEGFVNVKLKYMGGFWVMIVFTSEGAKETFRSKVGIGSWFAQLLQSSNSFFVDERVTWIDIEGIPLKGDGYLHSKRVCIKTTLVENIYESFKVIIQGKTFWIRAKEVSGWMPDFEEDIDQDSKSDDELSNEGSFDENGRLRITLNVEGETDLKEVAESIFEKEQASVEVKEGCNNVQKETRSEDPFNIYDLLDKKKSAYYDIPNFDDTLKIPPGFTPETDVDAQKNASKVLDMEGDNSGHKVLVFCFLKDFVEQDNQLTKNNSPLKSYKNDKERSTCSCPLKKCKIPVTGGSDLVRSGVVGSKIATLLLKGSSVIVNGSPTKEFQFHRGLKQGDPLSPFLFLLIIESLHISMQRVVDAGLFRVTRLDLAARKLDVQQSFCAFLVFLVHKVGCLMSRFQSWCEDVNQYLTRLSKWKLKTISIGGRLTLLKSVLGSLPIYHMSSFKVPAKETDLMRFIHRKMGNGVDIRFWEDKWRGDNTFQSNFPRIVQCDGAESFNIFSRDDYGGDFNSFRFDGEIFRIRFCIWWEIGCREGFPLIIVMEDANSFGMLLESANFSMFSCWNIQLDQKHPTKKLKRALSRILAGQSRRSCVCSHVGCLGTLRWSWCMLYATPTLAAFSATTTGKYATYLEEIVQTNYHLITYLPSKLTKLTLRGSQGHAALCNSSYA